MGKSKNRRNRGKLEKRDTPKKCSERSANDVDVSQPPPPSPAIPQAVPITELPPPPPQPEPPTEQVNGTISKVEETVNEVPIVNSTDHAPPTQDEPDDDDLEQQRLKYDYKEDQWSPLNPEGKRAYDREFLLQFQDIEFSKQKPAGLPDLPEIIKDSPNVHRLPSEVRNQMFQVRSTFSGGGGGGFDFAPAYIKGGGMGGPQRGPITKRGSQQGNKGQGGRRIIQVPSLNKEVELHKAENAWKPTPATTVSSNADDDDKTATLNKKVRSILNKLTPQKFEKLVQQVKDLEIDTQTKLSEVINLVFEKAIDEPGFSVAYAKMCSVLSTMGVPSDEQQGQQANFRKLLITRCQKEFERDKLAEFNKKEKLDEIEATEDKEKKKELQAEYEESERKLRRRALGNIRFIGELYKLKMLTANIMHMCLEKLIQEKEDEESIECLCRLLTTIGAEMERENMAQRSAKMKKPQRDLNPYFEEMQLIVDQRLVSSRVRFMLQDVMDLRLNKWNPRREDNKPKTIDQVRKEAEQERHREDMLNQQTTVTPGRRDNRDHRDKKSRSGPVIPDAWIMASGGSKFPKYQDKIDPNKRIQRMNVDDDIQLGPPKRMNASWGRGASGASGNRPAAQEDRTTDNRYSILSSADVTPPVDTRTPGRGSGNRGKFQQQPMVSERESALAAVRHLGNDAPKSRSQTTSRESSLSRAKETKSPVFGGTPNLTEEEVGKLTDPLIDEFLHHCDLKEAVACVKEKFHVTTMPLFVIACIEKFLERSMKSRLAIGQLFSELLKNSLLTESQYVEGFRMMLSMAEDMLVDIPKFWNYVAEIIAPVFQNEVLRLAVLKDLCKMLTEPSHCERFVSAVLQSAGTHVGEGEIHAMWVKEKMDWSVFLRESTNPEIFIKENKLEFITEATTRPPTREPLAFESIRVQVYDLLKKPDGTNKVMDWIEANIDGEGKSEVQFIRALMTAVCENAIIGVGSESSLSPDTLRATSNILNRYIDHKDVLELQALYAIQALVHKLEHPSTLLKQLFETLYDVDVISEEGFCAWEQASDPAEFEGHAVALKSVTQFMFWLKEAEEDSS